MEVKSVIRKLAVYVHIPFCKQKCKYCDFTSFYDKNDFIEEYAKAVCKEIESYDTKDFEVTSVYFGGGTPSFIDSKYIRKIFEKIRETYRFSKDMENTIEANPGTVNIEKLIEYKSIGFNRISYGAQAFQDKILKDIGRIHNSEEIVSGYNKARDAGFDNISLDLMFGLPEQKLEDVKETLNKFIEVKPEHISAYSLKVEENTVFGKMQKEGKLKLPEEEQEREMYYLIKNVLKDNGYIQYEISNFAKPGFESRHNTAYWERQDYLGLGLGASSCFNEVRFSNTEDLESYINNPIGNFREKEVLTNEVIASEKVILGLRMLKGIEEKLIAKEDWKNAVSKLKAENLLTQKGGRLFLTDKGLDLANQVFVEFI